MSLVAQVKGFFRVFRFGSGKKSAYRHSGHALARTLKDVTQTGGAGKSGYAPGTSRVEQIAAESAERYDQSFDD